MAYLVSRLIRLAVKHPIGQFILAASFIFLGVDGIIEALAAHHSDLVGYLITDRYSAQGPTSLL